MSETRGIVKYSYPKVVFRSFIDRLKKLSLQSVLYLIAGGIMLAVLTTLGTYIYFAQDISSKERILNRNNTGVTLLDDQEEPFFTFNQPKTIKYTPLNEIPEVMQQAVIAAEDKDFYQNPGFSITGIGRAFITNVKSRGIREGGSTISQELVKNALLHSRRTIFRKYQEIVLAIELNRRYSKDDILELYLNSVYFGEGAFGVENAAQAYFGKSAKELTLTEASMLTALLPAPSILSPISNDPAPAERRQANVLQAMVTQKYISQGEADRAKIEELNYSPSQDVINDLAPHFALYVKSLLIKEYGEEEIIRSGFKVKTTLNSEWQRYAETTVKNQIARLAGNNASNGAAVVLDPETGFIKVMVGSEDWHDENHGKINMAIAPRQPGSSFKPIVYAKAIESRKITAATILQDSPKDFGGGYKPLNYDKRFRGPVTVRRSLANSLNIPSVEIMQDIGVRSGVEIARDLGITTIKDSSDYGLSLVLGSAEVPLLEMTSAFSIFANEGERNSPIAIMEIKDKYGNVIFNNEPKKDRVLSDGTAYIISSILSDSKARSEVFGGALTISRPAAVKTGTTENYRDALTIGYTPSLVVGVWVGNNDNTPMDNVAGSLGAAPVWRLLMERYLAGTTIETFRKPTSVVEKMVCPYGLPKTEENKDENNEEQSEEEKKKTTFIGNYPEFFLKGTEPDSCVVPTAAPSPTPEGSGTPSPTETPVPTQTSTPTPQPTSIPQVTVQPTIVITTATPTPAP
ncbi:MAG TPA: PBP1A family penicillin-binding protein [Candidatus Nitrosocosmicus sp.]|nr:PBP1A family penicillin-binding protein [Candidatus Nitrosocosmicus sp.]